MKKLIFLLLILSACSPPPDMQKAKDCMEGYFGALTHSDFSSADQFYSDNYDPDGSNENRIKKMKKLQSVLGPVQAWYLVDSATANPSGGSAGIELTYTVKHDKTSTREKYTVTQEGATYKITSQTVENK
jgi:hypothetical protein